MTGAAMLTETQENGGLAPSMADEGANQSERMRQNLLSTWLGV